MNYISRHTIMSMLSKNYILLDNNDGHIKNKKEVVLYTSDDARIGKYLSYPKINLYYVDEIANLNDKISGYALSSKFNSTILLSNFNQEFFELKGQNFREIREARNKYRKIVTIKYDEDPDKVIDFIREWIEKRGNDVYGWQLHAGHDINFFAKYYNDEKDKCWNNFFYMGEKLVGYSIVSREDGSENYKYLIRKNDTSYRNLCLYIDFETFFRIYGDLGKEFIINWGCSSGSLLKYKMKFPRFLLEKKWFYKFKKNNFVVAE